MHIANHNKMFFMPQNHVIDLSHHIKHAYTEIHAYVYVF